MGRPPLEDKLDLIEKLAKIYVNTTKEEDKWLEAYRNNIKSYKKAAPNSQQRIDLKAAALNNLTQATVKHNVTVEMITDFRTAMSEIQPLLDERKKWIKDMRKKWTDTLAMVKKHNDFLKANKFSAEPMKPPIKEVEKRFTDQEKFVTSSEAWVKKMNDWEKKPGNIELRNAEVLYAEAVKFKKLPP
jgi:hypothetical protein